MTDQQILEQLGLTNVDDASREVLIGQINAVVELRLIGMVTALLSDEQLEQFKQLQDAGDNEATWNWLNGQLTDLDELRHGVLTEYLKERAARN